jgi:hypothetical protein
MRQACRQIMGTLVTPATLAFVHITDDLPNGRHLEINDALELRANDTHFVSSCADTTLSASEGYFMHIDGQLGNLHADALCHRPAMSSHFFGTVRHLVLPRCQLWFVLGRVGWTISSLLHFAVCLR